MTRFIESRTTRVCALAIAASLFSISNFARADDTPQPVSAENLATAREALREGLALREAGDLPGALAKLHLAHTLIAIPVTAYELGKTQMVMGQLLSARELFLEVGRLPRSIEESERSDTARRESAKLADELEPNIPALHFRITLPKGAVATVRIDGVLVPEEALAVARRVNPGTHEVIARAGDGPEQRLQVVVHDSESKDVDLAPQWIPPKEAPAPTRPFYVKTTTNPFLYIGAAAGVAGAVTASVGLILFFQGQSDGASQCFSSYCPTSAQSDFNRSLDGKGVAIAGASLAAVGVAMFGYGLFHPNTEKVYTAFEPIIGPTSAGFRGSF